MNIPSLSGAGSRFASPFTAPSLVPPTSLPASSAAIISPGTSALRSLSPAPSIAVAAAPVSTSQLPETVVPHISAGFSAGAASSTAATAATVLPSDLRALLAEARAEAARAQAGMRQLESENRRLVEEHRTLKHALKLAEEAHAAKASSVVQQLAKEASEASRARTEVVLLRADLERARAELRGLRGGAEGPAVLAAAPATLVAEAPRSLNGGQPGQQEHVPALHVIQTADNRVPAVQAGMPEAWSEETAATRIQATYRGQQVRRAKFSPRGQHFDESYAATKIQANYRGRTARKQLRGNLFGSYNDFANGTENGLDDGMEDPLEDEKLVYYAGRVVRVPSDATSNYVAVF